MLFSSFAFLFVFLPISVIGFHIVGRFLGDRASLAWLLGASAIFYGWWNPAYVALLAASIIANYVLATTLLSSPRYRRFGLWIGVGGNLALLVYYKYVEFLVSNWNALTGDKVRVASIVLPLAISFVTFKQIGYLADTARGVNRDRDLLRYALFVSFFPQLIAGPIVHARELIPQLGRPGLWRLRQENFAIGLTFIAFGLAKKILIADALTPHVDRLFTASASGVTMTTIESWVAALGFTLQIYFDFSGYSDIATGLARLFGILLPENFHSPYKATSIAEFWNRWHITLSRFLRDRIYFPLTLRRGRPRAGPARRWAAIFLTMTLGGIWHGAGWTYVAWGASHGTYLALHDAWRLLRARLGPLPLAGSRSGRAVARALTFLAVVLSMILFRAESITSAISLLGSFFGLHGGGLALLDAPEPSPLGIWWGGVRASIFLDWVSILPLLVTGVTVCFFSPNSQEILGHYSPTFYRQQPAADAAVAAIEWRPNAAWALAVATAWIVCVLHLNRVATFVYFQF